MTPWTVAHQSPLSMEISRQQCWSVLSFPTPGDLPDPAIEPGSLESSALAGRFFTTTGEPIVLSKSFNKTETHGSHVVDLYSKFVLWRQRTPHICKKGMKRFIIHITRLSGENRAGSPDGPKMASEIGPRRLV